MRYLAFDIECCDSKHICEFGYVITDETFNVINKSVLTINPEAKFNLKGRSDAKDVNLFFTEEQYYNSPIFSMYYNEIKSLLESPNQIVVGHAVGNDADFLRTACKRYKLPPINFSFFDSQKAYGEYANLKKSISLENAEEVMDLPKPKHLHKSDDDALLTMQIIQVLCKNLEVTLPQLMELCPTACGSTKNHMIRYTGNSLKEMLLAIEKNPLALSNKKREKCIIKFNEQIIPQGEIIKSELNGKKYCFSRQFEIENIRIALILMQQMKNHGCSYNSKVSENELYIATNDEITKDPEPHSRYIMAVEKRNLGGQREVLTFMELYKLLNITENSLKQMRVPIVEEKIKNDKAPKTYSTETFCNTIGDILKAQGIDLENIQQKGA